MHISIDAEDEMSEPAMVELLFMRVESNIYVTNDL